MKTRYVGNTPYALWFCLVMRFLHFYRIRLIAYGLLIAVCVPIAFLTELVMETTRMIKNIWWTISQFFKRMYSGCLSIKDDIVDTFLSFKKDADSSEW